MGLKPQKKSAEVSKKEDSGADSFIPKARVGVGRSHFDGRLEAETR